jgi:hypothetical protein
MAAVVVARTVVAEAVTAAVVEARAAVAVEAAPTVVVAEARTVVGEAVPAAVVVARTEAVHTDTKFQIYKARPKLGRAFFCVVVFPRGYLLTTLRRHRCFVE